MKKIETFHHVTSHTCHTRNSSPQLILDSSWRSWTAWPPAETATTLSSPPSYESPTQSLPPGNWMQFSQGLIWLSRYKLLNLDLDHTQVSLHLHLLESSILWEKEGSLYKHFGDLRYWIIHLLEWYVLLYQSRSVHQWSILFIEHLQKLFPSHYDSLCLRESLGQKLLPILRTPEKKNSTQISLSSFGTWTCVKTSICVTYPSQSDNQVIVASEFMPRGRL